MVYRIAKTRAENSVKMDKPVRDDKQTATQKGENFEKDKRVDSRGQKYPHDVTQAKVAMSIVHTPRYTSQLKLGEDG